MKKFIAFILSVMMFTAMFVIAAPADSVNLAAGKTAVLTYADVSKGELASLTDGKKGVDDDAVSFTGDGYASTANDGWTWSGEIFVFADFDLGTSTSITSVSVFMTNSAWDIVVLTSADNETWTKAATIGSIQNYPVGDSNDYKNPVLNFDAVTARYVRVGFGAGTNAPTPSVTEIEIIGEGTAAPDTSSDESKDESKEDTSKEESKAETSKEEPENEGSKEPATDSQPGDASDMIVFAVIALVAIAGSAVVIKSRG